jgi:hypothetical protein
MDLQAIIQMLQNMGGGGTATGQTNQPQPAGMNLPSLATPPIPVQSQGGQPNLAAAIGGQGTPLDNRAAPPIPPAPSIGLTGPGPQLNAPAVPPIPAAPIAPAAPAAPAPQPSMYDTAFQQQQASLQKQRDAMGINFGDHPIKSILNILASVGGGFGYGFHHQKSPWEESYDALNTPGLANNLAREQVAGQTEGQMAPLKVEGAKTNIAGEKQAQQQSATRFPVEMQNLRKQARLLSSHAMYFRRMANNKGNPKVAAISKETDGLLRQGQQLVSQIDAIQSTPTAEGRIKLPQLEQQLISINQQIATRRQAIDQAIGYEGGQPGSAAQPSPDQQLPSGDPLGLGIQ